MLSKINTKLARLSRKDHIFALLFLFGAAYLGSIYLRLPLAEPAIPIAAGYALFLGATHYRRVKGRVYQDSGRGLSQSQKGP